MQRKAIYRDDEFEIRPLDVSEAPALCEAVQSSLNEIGRWETWCTESFSLEDASNFLQFAETDWAAKNSFNFNIIAIKTGLIVGAVAINCINHRNQMANVGYWVRTDHTRRGIAVLAAKTIVRFAFDRLGLTRLEIVMQEGNLGSQRVAEKLGAQFETLARHRLVYRGEPRAAKIFSLIPEDIISA
ncbi:GNAT family N-acetyltransferase [Glaciimonas soli]|nr:GNAT family N-acetyltransferase [Glaciimonas soli]